MKAWSTLRKRANESGLFARQTRIDGRPAFLLLDPNNNVVLATRSQRTLQERIYSL